MSDKWKYCQNCHKKVNSVAIKCPYCNSTSFEINESKFNYSKELTIKNRQFDNISSKSKQKNNDFNLKYYLFYWKEESGLYAFSKTKFLSIVFFLIIFLIFSYLNIVLGLIFGIFTFIISFVIGKHIHDTDKKLSSKSKENNNLSLDILHMLLFWKDNSSNNYELSKTKIISYLILIFIIFSTYNVGNISFSIFLGLFFMIPAYFIGYIIHDSIESRSRKNKNLTGNKTKNLQENKTTDIPKNSSENKKTIENEKLKKIDFKVSNTIFTDYEQKINELINLYGIKENSVYQLIDKRFTQSSITAEYFLSLIDQSSKLFNNQVDVLITIMSLSDKKTPEIESEIESRIQILETLVDKLDSLKNELILNIGVSKSEEDEDIKNLLENMEELITSVKNYD